MAFLAQLALWLAANGPKAFEMVAAVVESFKDGVLDKEALREALKPFDTNGTQTRALMAILDAVEVAEAEKRAEDSLK